MESPGFLTEEFAEAASLVWLHARQSALAAGHSVVFLDQSRRYVEEHPDGRRFEVRFRPGEPRESHIEIIGELPSASRE